MSWLDALDILTAIVALALLIGGTIWLGLCGIRRRLNDVIDLMETELELSANIEHMIAVMSKDLDELKSKVSATTSEVAHINRGGRKPK